MVDNSFYRIIPQRKQIEIQIQNDFVELQKKLVALKAEIQNEADEAKKQEKGGYQRTNIPWYHLIFTYYLNAINDLIPLLKFINLPFLSGSQSVTTISCKEFQINYLDNFFINKFLFDYITFYKLCQTLFQDIFS